MIADEKVVADIAAQDGDSCESGMANIVSKKQNYLLKMDLRLIPILGCTYTILFLDRTNSKSKVSIARLNLTSRSCKR